MTWKEDTLHVHASEHPHEEAYLVGTPDALRKLRETIDRALANGRPEFAVSFAADGESYATIVIPETDMAGASLPYAEGRALVGWGPTMPKEAWARLKAALLEFP